MLVRCPALHINFIDPSLICDRHIKKQSCRLSIYVYLDIMILICPLKSLSSLLWVNNRTCQFTNQDLTLISRMWILDMLLIFTYQSSHLDLSNYMCIPHIIDISNSYYFSRYKSTIKSIIISNITRTVAPLLTISTTCQGTNQGSRPLLAQIKAHIKSQIKAHIKSHVNVCTKLHTGTCQGMYL